MHQPHDRLSPSLHFLPALLGLTLFTGAAAGQRPQSLRALRGNGPATPQLGEYSLNFGIASGDINGLEEWALAGDRYVLFPLDEWREGQTDANGDGDAFDQILHVYNANTRTISNLGLATNDFILQSNGRYAVFLVDEEDGGEDYNGDGDQSDLVVHAYDGWTGTITNLELCVSSALGVELRDFYVYISVNEFAQGADLNGNGSQFDRVAHVYDLSSGKTTNLGLASNILAQLGPGHLAFRVDEVAQGVDLNGNGTALDFILFVYDVRTEALLNTEMDFGRPLACQGRSVLCEPRESRLGVDLNGDGDQSDRVLVAIDVATAEVTNLGVAITTGIRVESRNPRWFPVTVLESGQGDTDLNGDGDATDVILHVYDDTTRTLTNLGLNAAPPGQATPLPPRNMLAFWVDERFNGAVDLNGDGDADDKVLHVHNLSSGITTNLGLAASGLTPHIQVEGDQAAFAVVEAAQGATDANGDGDASDSVLHIYDQRTGEVFNTGLATAFEQFAIGERFAQVLVSESKQAGLDLNSDGDTLDHVHHLIDLPNKRISNTGLARAPIEREAILQPGLVVLDVTESEQGQDLNGDGDLSDLVLWAFGN